MSNYIIENNIDFFKLLKESLDPTAPTNNVCKNVTDKDTDTEYCLISNKELTKDNTITLSCHHKFDYVALFKEVKSFKENYQNYLRVNELRCPYCRKVQNKLLPFMPDKINQRCHGVNSPERYTMMPHNCQYVFKSGKNKGLACNKACYGKLCKAHLKVKESKQNKPDVDVIAQNIISKMKNKQMVSLNRYTMVILKKVAKTLGLKNYSKLKKKDLIIKIKEGI
jgi:hypothetical protein